MDMAFIRSMLRNNFAATKSYQFIYHHLMSIRGLATSMKYYRAAHSFSQCGEDLIINFIFENHLKINRPSYLDIGAHHPTHLSNTYFFYQRGSQGVCIEPDPDLCEEIRKKRSRDVCLNAGVGISSETKADFYVMTAKTLNTFSKEEAERYQSYETQKIEKVLKIPLIPINETIQNNFKSCPNLVSLDVEGLDLDILKSFDFAKYRPEIFCVETLTYTEDKSETKITEINDLLASKEYMVYADTYINTIFVDKNVWVNR